jgi:hypothetical protein
MYTKLHMTRKNPIKILFSTENICGHIRVEIRAINKHISATNKTTLEIENIFMSRLFFFLFLVRDKYILSCHSKYFLIGLNINTSLSPRHSASADPLWWKTTTPPRGRSREKTGFKVSRGRGFKGKSLNPFANFSGERAGATPFPSLEGRGERGG